MGLSSSQGRLLMLTSRMSDIEFQQIMLSQRQNRLAWDQEKVAKEYSEAMNNFKLEIRMPDSTDEDASYKNQPVNFNNLSQMGYLICDAQGNIYLQKGADGKWVTPQDMYGNDLVKLDDPSAENPTARIYESLDAEREEILKLRNQIELWEKEDTSGFSEEQLAEFNKQVSEAKAKVEKYDAGNGPYKVIDGGDMISNSEILQQQIMNGQLYIINTNDRETGLTPNILASDTEIQWVLDTSDDAMAESKYNYETTQLERKENAIQMEIKQLDTQYQAISKEYESVEKLIESNIERTFKLFSSG